VYKNLKVIISISFKKVQKNSKVLDLLDYMF